MDITICACLDPDAGLALPVGDVPRRQTLPGLILGLCPANERRRYKVTPSLIGLAQT